jgi:fucose 4-O-acetylase-like acetyltransferase
MSAFGSGAGLCDTLSFFNLILVLLGVLYFVVLSPFLKRRRTQAEHFGNEELLQNNAVEEGIAKTPVESKPARPTVRSAYLDNLKVFLTVLVVLHHVVCTFSTGSAFTYNVSISRGTQLPYYFGYSVDNCFASVFSQWFLVVNQSYFMCLFFFISGFFTPSSFDRKGRVDFLKDKFKRLGVPLLCFYLVYGPLMNYLEAQAFFGETGAKYWYDAAYKNSWFSGGPPWFVMWLLNFNVVYAFTDGAPIILAAPSSALVFLAAFAVGMIQFVVPATGFIQVPMGLNQLVVNLIFFSVGVLAKRGAWLDSLAKLDTGTVWFIRFWALLLTGVFLVYDVDVRPYFVKDIATYSRKTPNTDIIPFFMGVSSVILSFAQLQLWQAHFGGSRNILKWASSAAYTVYLIHPPFVVFGAYLYVLILQACGMEVTELIYLADGVTFAPNPGWIIHTDHVEYMWLGFVFTGFVVCGLVLWPVAWCLAKLPGFRLVL